MKWVREFHREQLSIEHSMQDLDSAVGRLDNIFMSVYFVAALLIIAICMVCRLSNKPALLTSTSRKQSCQLSSLVLEHLFSVSACLLLST